MPRFNRKSIFKKDSIIAGRSTSPPSSQLTPSQPQPQIAAPLINGEDENIEIDIKYSSDNKTNVLFVETTIKKELLIDNTPLLKQEDPINKKPPLAKKKKKKIFPTA